MAGLTANQTRGILTLHKLSKDIVNKPPKGRPSSLLPNCKYSWEKKDVETCWKEIITDRGPCFYSSENLNINCSYVHAILFVESFIEKLPLTGPEFGIDITVDTTNPIRRRWKRKVCDIIISEPYRQGMTK